MAGDIFHPETTMSKDFMFVKSLKWEKFTLGFFFLKQYRKYSVFRNTSKYLLRKTTQNKLK